MILAMLWSAPTVSGKTRAVFFVFEDINGKQ